MSKLWQKDYPLDRLIEQFTVGEDYLLDLALVNADCLASIAHADMLNSIGILTGAEFSALKGELLKIIKESSAGNFKINIADEDCHTAIENHLTDTLGESGKKIHTGRSRNDQVMAALRLYSRSFLFKFQRVCLDLTESLAGLAERHSKVPMPGRTHMQTAMPSSVGLWAYAFAEEIIDDLKLIGTAYELNNMSPLGSAASYGVPLPLDRERTAASLAFGKVQNNVLYVNNSRGKIEAIILDAVGQVMLTLSKLAQDLILYSLPEFGYFTLPKEICTGSSIMPQKRNPDLLELIRARCATVNSLAQQVKEIIRALPSGYNRDYQETKAALMRGMQIGLSSVMAADLAVRKLSINTEMLLAGFRPEIFATDRALELVGRGKSFRDAYREVANTLDHQGLPGMDPYRAIEAKKHSGAPGNLKPQLLRDDIDRIKESLEREETKVNQRLSTLTGLAVEIYRFW